MCIVCRRVGFLSVHVECFYSFIEQKNVCRCMCCVYYLQISTWTHSVSFFVCGLSVLESSRSSRQQRMDGEGGQRGALPLH